jgi:hypothetical protein
MSIILVGFFCVVLQELFLVQALVYLDLALEMVKACFYDVALLVLILPWLYYFKSLYNKPKTITKQNLTEIRKVLFYI